MTLFAIRAPDKCNPLQLSNAQRHTHFLDSPRIARVLSQSDFHFSDLRHRIASVFLVLPPNRMDAYSRWLRLLGEHRKVRGNQATICVSALGFRPGYHCSNLALSVSSRVRARV
ncbi:type IV secretory system conjugative DNA transfer family protein [Roseovarius sp. MBR-51]